MVEDRDGIEGIREITNPDWMVGAKISSTFHGRDIFSPVGAHIARGDDWTQVGPAVTQLVRLDLKPAIVDDKGLTGEVIALDGPFGNLITNISADDFMKLGYQRGDKVKVTIAGHEIEMPFVKHVQRRPAQAAVAVHRFARTSQLRAQSGKLCGGIQDRSAATGVHTTQGPLNQPAELHSECSNIVLQGSALRTRVSDARPSRL